MVINYDKLQQSINEYGNYILTCIKNQYSNSLTQEQLNNLDKLLNTQFIVIEKPSNEDIEFFSKQAGITNREDYSLDYIPSAHGGRTKGDNKIHIYPYTKAFSDCKTDEEIIKVCIDDIVIHEIFHYFIRPNLSNENESIKDEFGHFITEGLVQYYAEEFAKKFRLGNPKSNYDKNVKFAKKLISSFPSNLTQTQIDKIIFTSNQDELLEIANNGKTMYEEFVSDFQFKEDILSFVTIICMEMGMDKYDKKLEDILRHYKKIEDFNIIFDDLSKNVELAFEDNINMRDSYMLKLRNLFSDRKLETDIFRYEEQIQSFLPIEDEGNKLRR